MQLIQSPDQSLIPVNADQRVTLQPFFTAFESKLVRDASDKEILSTLNEIVSKATFEGGYTAKSAQEIMSMIGSLLPDCKMFWKTLTLDELKLAANRGIRGMYGEIIGVSVASLSKMFNGYMNEPKRHEAKKALHETMEVLPERDEKQIIADRIAIVLNAFEKYKEQGFYDDLGNYVYDCLKTAGIIKYTGKEVGEFIVTAIRNLIERKNMALIDCTDMNERRKLKADILVLSGDEVEVTADIKAESKRLMLFARFDEMMLEEEDLAAALHHPVI